MNTDISVGHGLLIELLITFELVFTVFATCDPNRTDLGGSAGLAIGFAVAIGHFFAVSKPRKQKILNGRVRRLGEYLEQQCLNNFGLLASHPEILSTPASA